MFYSFIEDASQVIASTTGWSPVLDLGNFVYKANYIWVVKLNCRYWLKHDILLLSLINILLMKVCHEK